MKTHYRNFAITAAFVAFIYQACASTVLINQPFNGVPIVPTSTDDIVFTDWTSIVSAQSRAEGNINGYSVVLTGGQIPGGVTDGSSTRFRNSHLFTPLLELSDVVYLNGTRPTAQNYTVSFSIPTINPVFHFSSLASAVTFQGATPIKLSGDATFTVNEQSVTGALNDSPSGYDANGSIQLLGEFTEIHFSVMALTGFTDGIHLQIGGIPAAVIVPRAPQNVRTQYGSTDDDILIYWDAVAGATSYRVYRARNAFNPHQAQLVADVGTATMYEHNTSGAWVYYVQTINANGASEYSFPVWGSSRNTVNETLGIWSEMAVNTICTVATIKNLPIHCHDSLSHSIFNLLPESITRYSPFRTSPGVIMTASPIDIELHLLSSGVVITKHNAQQHDCVYIEGDLLDNGSTSDMLIINRPIIEEYEIRLIPEEGSDGETFTAVFLRDGNMSILYEDEMISTIATYHHHEWRRPIVGIQLYDANVILGWDPISDGLNHQVEYSSDLNTWQLLDLDIEQSEIHSRAVVENASGIGFYRVVISNDD